eukprot:6173751-Pleurochrysis_carterae.AAC.2
MLRVITCPDGASASGPVACVRVHLLASRSSCACTCAGASVCMLDALALATERARACTRSHVKLDRAFV